MPHTPAPVDLVKWLRNRADVVTAHRAEVVDGRFMFHDEDIELHRLAADEIEQLRGRVAELEDKVDVRSTEVLPHGGVS